MLYWYRLVFLLLDTFQITSNYTIKRKKLHASVSFGALGLVATSLRGFRRCARWLIQKLQDSCLWTSSISSGHGSLSLLSLKSPHIPQPIQPDHCSMACGVVLLQYLSTALSSSSFSKFTLRGSGSEDSLSMLWMTMALWESLCRVSVARVIRYLETQLAFVSL